jgi:CubicO group peptidase (beta-lactamase class C family)
MQRLLSILLLLSTLSRAQSPIDSIMQLAYKRGIFNGNILVARHDSILYKKSFGKADGSGAKPLTTDMMFDIGSVSKEFNGTAIMILKEQGKLSLDDALAKYFPEFPSWAQQVRIKQLINYTSGLPIIDSLATGTDSSYYQGLLHLKALAFTPGSGYIYNPLDVYLQMRVIEKVSGLTYSAFVQKYIFRPAGMHASIVDYPVDAPRMARAFDNHGKNVAALALNQDMTGWVRLSIEDLYKWTKALHSGKIISAASLKELSENFPGGESSLGSTGYEKDQLIWHQHQGSFNSYEAVLYSQVPEQITIVMMTNHQEMKVIPLKSAIMAALHNQPVIVPKRSVYLQVRDSVLANTDMGLAYYKDLKANHQDVYDFSFEIGDLISTGKYLERRKHFDDAIKVFREAVATDAAPHDLSYGYELMAECYFRKGEMEQAKQYYAKAVELEPKNKNAEERMKDLSGTK